jgi:hypothetical protein
MAYKEFQVEKIYEAPDQSGFLDKYNAANAAKMQGITNVFRSMQQKQELRRKTADQFQYDLDQGAFENDTKILGELAKNVTTRAKTELREGGKLSADTDMLMKDGVTYQQSSKNQMERLKQLRQNIADRKGNDNFYNPQPDLDLLKEAANGKNNDVDFRTRGERLNQAEKQVGGLKTFLRDKYTANYIKEIGTQFKKNEFPTKSGSTMTKYDQRTFWKDDGTPGVEDKHVVRFLNSEPRVAQSYENDVNQQLDEEIDAMRNSSDSRTAWMKDLSDEEVKAKLIADPFIVGEDGKKVARNIINPTEYGKRVRDLAKKDLQEFDRVNSELSYSNIKDDKNDSGGAWKNDNILHNHAVNSYAQEAKKADGTMSTVNTNGPGGIFTQKNGKPILITSSNPTRTDINKGITTNSNKGNFAFNMTGYTLMPVRANNAPFALQSSDTEGMLKEIENIPLEHFNPNGNMRLKPTMQIGLNGFTINKANVLNDIQTKKRDLSKELSDRNIDTKKSDEIKDLMYRLDEVKEMVSSGEYDIDDLINATNSAGINQIQKDWLIPANSADIAALKNTTGGFDLNNKDFWSEDMKVVADAYAKRAEEAKAQGYGVKKEEPAKITVIESDGSDTDKWKKDGEYKVGNAVYYFDQTSGKWKKK